MTEAVGIHAHPTLKLGTKPEDKTRPKLRFGQFLISTPAHPLVDATPNLSYPMDRNDQAGDCVVAAVDHALQIIHTLLDGSYVNWSDAQLLAAYQTQNPGFASWADAGGPNDGGMIVAQFLDWCVQQGYILAYAAVDYTNEDEVKAATYLGLAIDTAETLQVAQQSSGSVWDYVPGSPDWGGHSTCWSGYSGTPDDDELISWGATYKMTQAFVSNRLSEAYFLLTQAHVNHPGFRDHFDLAAFSAAVSEITSGKIVIPVPPAPTPPPVPPIPKPPVPPAPVVPAWPYKGKPDYFGPVTGPALCHSGDPRWDNAACRANIALIQKRLIGLNYAGTHAQSWADGIYGPPTITAVKKFQFEHRLAQTGCVRSADWVALFSAKNVRLSLWRRIVSRLKAWL